MAHEFNPTRGAFPERPGVKLTAVALLAGFIILSACAGNSEDATERTVWVPDGAPTSCISLNQMRSIRVIDDRTINFEMTGRRVYRNELPFRCSGLSFNQAIRHNSRTSQLCSSNSFTVLSMGGGPRGPTCSLGRFQPVKRASVQPEQPAG